MHDRGLQAGGEFLDFGRPVAEQGGRRDQEAWLGRGLLHQQQRQDLDGLSQTHVVGQTGAEAETGQQVHPPRAGALVGAQRALQRGSGIGTVAVPGPQRFQGFLQPGAGGDAGPVGVCRGGVLAGDGRAGQHPHRLGEAQAVLGGKGFGLAEPIHGFFEPGTIDFDPLAAQQHEVVGAGEQGCDLVLGEGFAIEDHAHAEIEHAFQSEGGRLAAADGGGDSGPGRAVGTPGRGHADHDAGGFQFGQAVEEAGRLGRSPTQRMENLPGVDHRPQPVAVFGGALHRQQQRQKFVAVCRPGVFAQRLTERDVLGASLGGKAGRVGRHEGEGLFGVAAVLGKVEMHAADQIPCWVQGIEEALQAGAGGGERFGEGQRQFIPQRQQDRLGQVFRAGHHGGGQHQGEKLAGIEGRYHRKCDVVLAARRVQADRPDVAGGEAAPPDEDRWQGVSDLTGAEPHQAGAGPLSERCSQAVACRGVDLRRVVLILGDEAAVRSEA